MPKTASARPNKLIALSPVTLARGLRYLAERDSDLALIFNNLGAPPLWRRAPGFNTLIQIILEQQVSLASAKAAHDRLLARVTMLTPQNLLALGDDTLRVIGFSRQKTAYSRYLAQAIVEGSLDLESLSTMDDESVRRELTKIKGIGAWTAEIYLLMALGRPDAWPRGDLALAIAVQKVKGLAARPAPDVLEEMGERWRPWRAVAARLFWHYYLSTKR